MIEVFKQIKALEVLNLHSRRHPSRAPRQNLKQQLTQKSVSVSQKWQPHFFSTQGDGSSSFLSETCHEDPSVSPNFTPPNPQALKWWPVRPVSFRPGRTRREGALLRGGWRVAVRVSGAVRSAPPFCALYTLTIFLPWSGWVLCLSSSPVFFGCQLLPRCSLFFCRKFPSSMLLSSVIFLFFSSQYWLLLCPRPFLCSHDHFFIISFETCFKFLLLRALVSNLMTLKSNGVKLTLRKSSWLTPLNSSHLSF